MFDVNIYIEQNEIIGEFVADSYFFEPSKYEYAYYLYKNGERVDTVWYKRSMKVRFLLEDMSGDFFVKAFIKDIELKNIRNYNSEKISVAL